MLTKLLLLSVLTMSSKAACAEGCLRCGENDNCLFCNYDQAYVLRQGTCVREVDTKCLISGFGKCFVCNNGYYLDMSTERCVRTGETIDNCLYYTTINFCNTCTEGYYPSQGRCLQVPAVIEHCRIYENASFCRECHFPFVPTTNRKGCIRDQSLTNCRVQTNLRCNSCAAGYLMNKNHYIHSLYEKGEAGEQLVSFEQTLRNRSPAQSFPTPCEKITLEQCKVPETAVTCATCENGYYLTGVQKCERNPFVEILNCEVYSNHNVCERCQAGFYRVSQTECKKQPEIDNCEVYSRTVQNKCDTCTSQFYVNGNICTARVLTLNLSGCAQTMAAADLCQRCEDGLVLTNDNRICLPRIENCNDYAQYQSGDTQMTCLGCFNGTKLNSAQNLCVQGDVDNCESYSDDSRCNKCQNGYYLIANENRCQKHDDLSACLEYSGATANQCTKCINNHFLFAIENACLKANNIDFCLHYDSQTTCTDCQEGYFLNQDRSACEAIPAAEHCLRKSGGVCTKCQPDYYRHSTTNLCLPHFLYQKDGCLTPKDFSTTTTAHVDQLVCAVCKPGFHFKDLTNKFLCLDSAKIPVNSVIQNCKRYILSGNTYECIECHSTHYLKDTVSGSQECVTTCNETFHPYLYSFNGNDQIDKVKKNYCDGSGNDGIYANSYFTGGYNVRKSGLCGNKIPVQGGVSSFRLDSDSLSSNNIFSYGYSYPAFSKCETVVTGNTRPNIADTQYHCLSYREEQIGASGTNIYTCIACKAGYTGKIISENVDQGAGNSETIKYIECNVPITGCSAIKYGGFFANRSSVIAHSNHVTNDFFYPDLHYSCHQCTQNDEIPIFFAPLSSSAKVDTYFEPFSLQQDIPENATSGTDLQLQCKKMIHDSFNMNTADFTINFISNCGLALMDTSREKKYTESVKTIFCVECAPGYKKVVNADNVTTGCEFIPNCNPNRSDKWFNSCSQCLNSHAWGWDNTKGPLYDVCVEKEIANCMVVDGVGQSQTCKICQKGFRLTNGKCEKFLVPKCQDFVDSQLDIHSYNISINGQTRGNNNFWLIAWLSTGNIGCERCDDGYVALLDYPGTHEACVSSYYQQNVIQEEVGNLIPNCRSYSGEEAICLQCNNNFVLRTGREECLPQASYPNCTEVNSQGHCVTCEKGFFVILNQCERGLILNCTIYNSSLSSNNQQCLECSEGYRPSSDGKKCILGFLEDCKIYRNTNYTSCKTCKQPDLFPIFQLSIVNSPYYCFKPVSGLNCSAFSQPSNNNKTQTIRCQTCQSGYYLSQDLTKFRNQRCLPFQTIANCEQYQTATTYFSSSFKCTQCKDGFYVDPNGYHCHERTVSIEFCQVMEPLSQKCKSCIDKYYVSADQTQCLPYPVGKPNCSVYQDPLTCLACYQNYYLKDQLCVEVPEANKVTNCVQYDAEIKCAQCNSSFILVDNTCTAPRALNCTTYANVTACATCPNNYYLLTDTDSGLTNCVFKNIDNCSSIDQATGDCVLCNEGWYLEGKTCLIAQQINDCIVYDSRFTCLKCDSQYYLAQDKKSCIAKGTDSIPPWSTCTDLIYQESRNCVVCDKGYYFDGEGCSSCQAGEGCAVCDPRNNTVCLLCMDNYFQPTVFGQCEKEKIPVNPIFQTDEGQENNQENN